MTTTADPLSHDDDLAKQANGLLWIFDSREDFKVRKAEWEKKWGAEHLEDGVVYLDGDEDGATIWPYGDPQTLLHPFAIVAQRDGQFLVHDTTAAAFEDWQDEVSFKWIKVSEGKYSGADFIHHIEHAVDSYHDEIFSYTFYDFDNECRASAD